MNLIQQRIECYDELLRASRGEIPVDLLITGGRYLNVLTGEILKGDIAVHKGFIVSVNVTQPMAVRTIDATGKIAVPALIDPHVHIESSMVLPAAYAEIVAAQGTGTIISDPHEIVNVMGIEGWSMMNDNTEGLPLRLYFDIPTCVPCKRGVEQCGADIRLPELLELRKRGGQKLGELMSYDDIIAGDPIMSDIVKTGWALGIPRDSHFIMLEALGGLFTSLNPLQMAGVFLSMIGSKLLRWPGANKLGVSIFRKQLRKSQYRDLNTYLTALGPTADHESYGPEIITKLDHGMRLMLSSHIFLTLPMMMPFLLQAVRDLRYTDAIGMCTDDMWPDDLLQYGGLAGVIRMLAKNGIDVRDAIRFATLNNAQRLAMGGIAEASLLGSVAPGMAADIALVEQPLKKFRVDTVVHAGKVVVEGGKLVVPIPESRVPAAALDTVQVPAVTPDTFRVRVPEGTGSTIRTRVMRLPKPPALPFPMMEYADLAVKDGMLDTCGYSMIAVFNRYGAYKGKPVIGLICNQPLKNGAVASTLAHDSHNLIVFGRSVEDMALAVSTVLSTKGGMAAVSEGKLLANLAFPVGGLMTLGSVAEVAPAVKAFRAAIAQLGLDPASPILQFAAFSLPASPGVKVTDQGIWDPDQMKLVSLFD